MFAERSPFFAVRPTRSLSIGPGRPRGVRMSFRPFRSISKAEGSFEQTEPLTVTNGGNEVLVGSCRYRCADAHVVGVEPITAGRIRVSFGGDTVIESGGPLPVSLG